MAFTSNSENPQPPNGPVPVPQIDLAAILGLLKTSGWKDKRLYALLAYPLLVVANNKWELGLTAVQLDYFAMALGAYILASAGKAAVIGSQFLKWFQQGGRPPDVVSGTASPPAKSSSSVIGKVLPAALLALTLAAPSGAHAMERSTLADSPRPASLLGVQELASALAPAYLLGAGSRLGAGRFALVPSVQLGGTLALLKLWDRPLSLFAGGGFLAADFAQLEAGGTLGLTYALTKGGHNEAGLTLYGTYSAGGWSAGLGLTVSNLFPAGQPGGTARRRSTVRELLALAGVGGLRL